MTGASGSGRAASTGRRRRARWSGRSTTSARAPSTAGTSSPTTISTSGCSHWLDVRIHGTHHKAEIGALEVLYTDFTQLRFAGGVRKAWLIPLLDHATRYVAGFAVGERANSGTGARGLDRGGADP